MDLKAFRKSYKLSQRDLAALFGCTQSHVSSIELGTRTLTKSQLDTLVDKYGVDTILPFASDSEKPIITLGYPKNEIKGNSGPVQQGETNTIASADPKLVEVINQQSVQISKLIDQQERLITLLEKCQNGRYQNIAGQTEGRE